VSAWLLLLLACGAPTDAPAPATAPPSPRPLVIVTLDTTRADRIGCYGYALAETPALDALAARGTRFDRAYTPVPLTIPSHASLFTGLMPQHHGVRDNGDQRLSRRAITLAEILSEQGWRTHASVSAFVTQHHWGFGQGFEGYDDSLGVPSDRLSWRAERSGSLAVDDALAALEQGADFLWVHLFEPHAPYEPPEPFRTRHEGRPYDGEIAAVDAQLGRLLAALPPEALVLVAGDHGEGLGEGGEQQHGMLLNDATLRVPLVLAGVGVPVGVEEHPVSLVDVAPTLLRLLGVEGPPDMDGQDLFETGERPGVYAETHYGHAHYGWSSLHALIGPRGRLVRGARDETQGTVDPAMRAALESSMGGHPRWEPEPITLDPSQVEQLQALGYLGAPTSAEPAGSSVDPRDGIHSLQALHELQGQHPAEQERRLRAMLSTNPAFRDARFRLGMLLARSGRLEEAMAELATLYTRAPDSTAAVTMAELWMQAGDHAEALQWYREAAGHDPRSLTARAGEVEALVGLGLLEEAQAIAELALEEAPDHAQLQASRALLALQLSEPLGSWPDRIAALALERPYESRLSLSAGRLLAAAGRPEEAMEMLRSELSWRPWNLGARLDLHALFSAHGRHVDAYKTIRPLLALQPDEPAWQALAAASYLAMGREDLAAPHLQACGDHPACDQALLSSSP
jgi:choline-sulfatase